MHLILIINLLIGLITFGNVTLLDIDDSYLYNNNAPIEELNNYTLREVFEGGNLAFVNVINQVRHGITITNNGNNTYSLNGTATATSERQLTTIIIPTNGNIYMRGVVGGSELTYRNIVWYNNTDSNFQNIYNDGYIKLFNNVIHTNISFWYRVENGVNVNIINKPYIISMEDFGISHLSVEQMNNYYNQYQLNLENELQLSYTINELSMTDLIILLSFGFTWFAIVTFITRKLVF